MDLTIIQKFVLLLLLKGYLRWNFYVLFSLFQNSNLGTKYNLEPILGFMKLNGYIEFREINDYALINEYSISKKGFSGLNINDKDLLLNFVANEITGAREQLFFIQTIEDYFNDNIAPSDEEGGLKNQEE